MLTNKENAELKRLDRKILNGKATRAEVMRGIELKRAKAAKRPYTEPTKAFELAIAQGRLSADPASPIFAGNYMYMGPSTANDVDCFKHIETRKYLAWSDRDNEPTPAGNQFVIPGCAKDRTRGPEQGDMF